MKRWLKRFGYATFFVVWLFFMCVPAFVGVVIVNGGELTWGDSPENQMRVFIMQEVGKEGMGFQWTRPINDTDCLQTTVRYIMLAGEAENVSSCQCLGDAAVPNAPPRCIDSGS